MTEASSTRPSVSLWDFALALYAQPGVSDACLDLQDRCKLDVNLLLFAVWCAAVGPGCLDASAFRECIAITASWREGLLKPLRALRREGGARFDAIPRSSVTAIIKQLQAVELDAERVELEMLETWAAQKGSTGGTAEPAVAAASNVVAYLAAAGVAIADAAQGVRTLLAAAFPRVSQA